MQFDFSEKKVLVTGASGGIGFAIASMFAKAGARVVFHYSSNKIRAETLFSALEGSGHLLLKMDLLEPGSVPDAFQVVQDGFGELDILINNAGIFQRHHINDCDFDAWQQVWTQTVNVNLLGPANLIYCAVPLMIKQGGGKIINITSRGAFRGEPEAPAYGASKAGLNALSQSMAKLLGPHHIHVYAIAPGFTNTERVAPTLKANQALIDEIPLGRVATPDEVARTTLFLADEGQASLTGCIIDINGASYLR